MALNLSDQLKKLRELQSGTSGSAQTGLSEVLGGKGTAQSAKDVDLENVLSSAAGRIASSINKTNAQAQQRQQTRQDLISGKTSTNTAVKDAMDRAQEILTKRNGEKKEDESAGSLTPAEPITPEEPKQEGANQEQSKTDGNEQNQTEKPTGGIAPTTTTTDYMQRLRELGGGDYTPSENVQAAQQYLQSILDNKPADYQSKFGDQLSALYDQIMNREKFNYDLNGDALYQQYKDQYQLLGRQAMQDTMGQAAAMTGGYGNSYASTAGNQAYQSYLQQLNDVVPELYQQAYNRYLQEGEDLQNKYAITQAAEQMDYGRWQDAYSNWQNERAYAYNAYGDERNFDYNDYTNRLSNAMNILGFERGDRLTQEGYDREDYLRADERAYNKELLDDERAYNKELTADERAYNKELIDDERAYNKELTEDERAYNKEMTEANWGHSDANDAKNLAYNLAMATIEKGALPSDALLEQAGISNADALTLAKEYGYREKSSSSSSKKKESSSTSSGSSSKSSTSSTTTGTATSGTNDYYKLLKKLTTKK